MPRLRTVRDRKDPIGSQNQRDTGEMSGEMDWRILLWFSIFLALVVLGTVTHSEVQKMW